MIEVAEGVTHLFDKEVGLSLKTLPAEARPHSFSFRKAGAIAGRARESLMRSILPTGNMLPGYTPSFAIGRVLEDVES